MSRTIDEKVVEMRFDNSDFERNVSQSMSTLDKLKGALNFSGMEKAFDGITSAANKVDFGHITGAFDSIGKQVSNLEKVIDGFFENIGRRLSNWSIDQIKSVTVEPILEGFNKYADKTQSVQMIMNAIRDGTKSDAELMQEVSDQLERLNWYTDETSYDFTEMVASIGKFTSAGIGLEEAVTAMEGIANWAGISGATKAEANRAMYNISQALSGGFMRLQDWKSIENANMATKEFKEMVIQAAINRGTLEQAVDEAGNIIYGVEYGGGFNEVNYKTVANTLTQGKWLTNEVLTDTLALYGAFTDELSKVYDDINETADVTTSQIIKMTNQWKDGTLDMNEAIAMTGKSAEELEVIFANLGKDEYDLGRRAFAAAQEAKTFTEAIEATKDAVSTGWMNIFEKLFGNYEEAKVLWTDLANELWEIFAGPISDMNDLLTAWRNNDDLGDGRDDLIEGLKNIYRAARSVIDPITEAWEAIFPSATYRDIWNFTHGFKEFTDRLILSEESMGQISVVFEDFFNIFKAFSNAFKNGGGFGKFFEGIGGIFKNGTDRIYDFILSIQRVRSAIDALENGTMVDMGEFYRIMSENSAAAKFVDTYEKVIKTVETLGQTFGKLFDYTTFLKDGALTLDSIIDGIRFRIAAILGSVSEIIHLWTGQDVSRTIDNIRNFLFDMTDGLRVLIGHSGWGRVKDGLADIGKAITETFGPAWKAAVDIFNDWLEGLRMILGGTSGDLDGFFNTIVNGLKSIADFIRSGKGAVEFVSEFLAKFLSLKDAIATYQASGGGIVGFLAVVNEKLKIILDTIADIIQKVTNFDVHGIGDSILSVIKGIGYAVLQAADTISKAFGWTDNPFAKVLGALGNAPEGEGFNISGVFDTIGNAFSRLGELVEKVSPGLSKALGAIPSLFGNIIDVIKKIDLETLIKVVQILATLGLIRSIRQTLGEISDTLEAYQKKLRADMLLAIAGAILAIAGAAVLISKIDAEKVGLVLGTLGIAFAGLIGMLVTSRFADAKSLAALPGTVLAVAAAMAVLAKAAEWMVGPIAAFAAMENFWDGMKKLGTVMLSFSMVLGVLSMLNQNGQAAGVAKSLGKLTTVLVVMLPVLIAYSKMDWDTFGSGLAKAAGGLVAFGTALTVFGATERKLSKGSHEVSFESLAKSILVLSGALAAVTALMFALTKLDGTKFFTSFGKLAGIIVLLAGAVALFALDVALLDKLHVVDALDSLSGAFMRFGIGLAIATAGVLALGLLGKLLGDSAKELADAGIDLIVVVLEAIRDRTPEIVALCVEIIAGITQGIRDALSEGGINVLDFFAGSAVIAGLIGLMALVKKSGVRFKDWAETALVLAGAAVLLVEMGALFYGIGELSALVGGPEGLAKFGEFAQALVHVFTDDWGVLAMFGAMLGLLVLVTQFGDLENGFKDTWKAFGMVWSIVTQTVALVDMMGLLFAATGGLINLVEMIPAFGKGSIVSAIQTTGEVFDAIIEVFVGKNYDGSSDPKGGLIGLFAVLGAAIGVLAALKITGGAGAVWSAFGTVWSAIVGVIAIIDTMAVLFAGVGALIAGIDEWTGKDEAVVDWINKAGDVMAAVSTAIGKFFGALAGGAVEGFSENVTETAIAAVKAMADVALTIAESGLVANLALWSGGPIGLAVMTAELGEMAPHFVEFAEGISGLSDETANKAAICAEALAVLIAAVPKTGGIPKIFLGEKDLEKFGKGLKAIGEGIASYAGTLDEYDEEALGELDAKTQKIVSIMEDLKDVTPETNEGLKWVLEGANDIATFGENLESFGTSLAAYSKTVSGDDVKIVAMNNVSSAVKNIGAWANDIAALGTDGIASVKSFGDAIKSFSGNLSTYYNNIKDIKTDKLESMTGAVNRMVKAFMGTSDYSFATSVITLTSEFLDELVKAFSGETTKKKSEEATDKFVDYFKERFKNATSISKVSVAISEMISKAVADGELKEGLKQAGISLVTEIGNGFTNAVDEEKAGLKMTVINKLNAIARGITNQDTTDLFATKGGELISHLRRGMFPDAGISSAFREAIVKFGTDVSNLFSEQVSAFQNAGKLLAGGVITGMTGVNLASEASSYAKNVTDGFVNSLRENASSVQKAVQETIVDTTKKTITAPMSGNAGKSGGLEIRSPSRWSAYAALQLVKGWCNSIYENTPKVRESIQTFINAAKDGMDYNGLLELAGDLGLDKDGSLADQISNYISNSNIDFGDNAEDILNSLSSSLQNDNFLDEIQSFGTSGLESYMSAYADNAYVNDGISVMTDNVSDSLSIYTDTMYDYGSDGIYSYYDGIGDNAISAAERIAPTISSASELVAEAATGPIADGMADILSYADWLAEKYPEGITQALSAPVFDFNDLYENMKGGELEAILASFDSMDESGRRNLIRSYGLGEQGGNEDLANYLQWYWKNEPIRLQNQENIQQSLAGYQTYLEEQKAAQEAQAIQSQQQYEGVQQIAYDMQAHTDEFNAKYMAVIEEIKMSVLSIQEELDGVRETIGELNNMDVFIDSDALVGATAEKYDQALGNIAKIGRRGI